MPCYYHTDRKSYSSCAKCGVELCEYCSQAIIDGEYYCYQCSVFGSDPPKFKTWIPFNYVLYAFIVMIAVMIVAILYSFH